MESKFEFLSLFEEPAILTDEYGKILHLNNAGFELMVNASGQEVEPHEENLKMLALTDLIPSETIEEIIREFQTERKKKADSGEFRSIIPETPLVKEISIIHPKQGALVIRIASCKYSQGEKACYLFILQMQDNPETRSSILMPDKVSAQHLNPKADNLYWESLEKMWESQKLSINIMESIPSAIFICKPKKILRGDIKLAIQDCNPAAENLIGKSLVSIQGKTLDTFWPRAGERDVIDQIAGVRKSKVATLLEETDSDEKGKIITAYNVRVFPMPNDQLGLIFEDISTLKHAEQVLEEENIRLKKLDEMKNNFIATTSHELKTPLASTLGAVQFLLMHYSDSFPEKELGLLKLINSGASRLNRLINSLLDLSRLETGRLVLEPTKADIVETIKTTVNELEYRIKERELNVVYKTPDKFEFSFDQIRVEQVITNLLTNAIKNTPIGGEIRITTTLSKDESEIIISVADTGVGITDDELDKLFQKFGKITRDMHDVDIQGTGLGLYISKEFITLHGGKIWAESLGRNMGSTFFFTLPTILDIGSI